MAKINGSVLRELREGQNLTLKALSEKSGVDESTIHRLETGARKGDGCRSHTVDGLCHALKVTPDILAGTVVRTMARTEPEPAKDQLNVRIDNGARNALNLVAARYNVPATRIVELAPLLFYMAAEKSLAERRIRVEEIWALENRWEELRNSIPQLPGKAVPEDDALHVEWRSIEKRDVLGRHVRDAPIHYRDDDDDELNPLGQSLKAHLEGVPGNPVFEYWYWEDAPNYRICRDEALDLVDGDAAAADAILSGIAPLHELPKELRQKSAPGSQRAAWVHERIAEAQVLSAELLADLLGDIPAPLEPSTTVSTPDGKEN